MSFHLENKCFSYALQLRGHFLAACYTTQNLFNFLLVITRFSHTPQLLVRSLTACYATWCLWNFYLENKCLIATTATLCFITSLKHNRLWHSQHVTAQNVSLISYPSKIIYDILHNFIFMMLIELLGQKSAWSNSKFFVYWNTIIKKRKNCGKFPIRPYQPTQTHNVKTIFLETNLEDILIFWKPLYDFTDPLFFFFSLFSLTRANRTLMDWETEQL